MKRNQKVQIDSVGRLYIKMNNNIYRPNKSQLDAYYPERNYKSELQKGEEVKVDLIERSPHIELTFNGKKEVWCMHGTPFKNGEKIPVEYVFAPPRE